MKNAKIWTALLIPPLFLFNFNPSAFAAFSLSISSFNPDSVSNSSQEVTVNVSINDLPSESYFRVAWQESSGKPYFGYMKNNNGDWIKVESSQDCKNYYKISDLTTTSLTIISKIGEENTVNNGTYLLKARRYTVNCSPTDSDSVSMQVNFSTATPTSSPTPIPTVIPTQIPTNSPTPKNTPTPTKTPTPTPTMKPSPTPKTPTPTKIPTPTQIKSEPTIKPTLSPTNSAVKVSEKVLPTSILGESTESAAKIEISSPEKEAKVFENSSGNLSKILIGIGVIILISCGILVFRGYMKNKKENENIYHK